ncbi:AmmeMemoRadiSam system protein B [Actinomyces oricola]|uniref:AmmeMemoRadiSam system protein B n=1 Tax=Actinomyces oricola TaxID=206043 RepID=UPI000FFF1870|nr:AmmeMemoRadiSam system protein B [Actinomyces oricola]
MSHTQSLRPPAVAGLFYPAEPARLRQDVAAMLDSARESVGVGDPPAALIVPHAGYVYSGPTAALAWVQAESLRERLRRVVLLGPTHRVGVRALALPGCRAMDTPVGAVAVEVPPEIEALAQTGLVVTRPDVHAAEHSLEVQLPFMAAVLPGVPVVPLAVGWVSPQEAARAVSPFLGRQDCLVVVSSDLSHYLPEEAAHRVDTATLGRILSLSADIDHDEACGATGVNALLLAAGEQGLSARLLGAATSADTIGSPDRVVGYCAVAFHHGRHGGHQ